ncbi:SPRY domain protein [Burkholderia multivorans]|uniref:SPRY domain-containing protein n=1 Tax=Burkholderia multivorans TaxID=87883 RepID=UPI000DAB4ED5|nr:SPRY domain-containing protein [Burkholderia multivorans]RAA28764.1 SPRY domain protein [Burkholderia multivorans]RAA32981.1 SPRY domain protein [Burkholderia multivorans]RAA33335.1 SPRY domain protein [Burkholderia multivorans]RAA48004.1 SPRY domain protein [Burkholderia multivorans]RAA50496.1 SPRY domain protein [Burkholderia multivorans]
MSSDGTTRLIFTMQSDQSTLVANFGPFLPLPISGTLQNVLNLVNNAESSVTNAINSASAANISATNAAASATAANTSANNAAASATAASTSATTASNYSTLAQSWASQATGPVNGTTSYSSYYYSEQSQYWAGVSQAVVAITASLDPANKYSGITLSNGNLTATFPGTQAGILGNVGYSAGKYYFEVTFTSGSNSGNASVGIAPYNEPLTNQIGYDDNSGAVGCFQNSGNIYINGSNKGSASSFSTVGNVLGVAVDLDDKLVWFRTGTGNWNGSGTADPVAKVGGISYTDTGKMYPAICTDSSTVFTANFTGNFAGTKPAGYYPWTTDAYHYVVPVATAATPGIVSAGPGLIVNTQGQLSADSYYDLAQVSGSSTISIDLTTPVPGYHVVLNAATATFSFANFSLPTGKALRLTFYFEQGTGSNTITSWDSRIHWVGGSPPVLGYTIGNRNVVEFESIDGTTFAGYYVGQIN